MKVILLQDIKGIGRKGELKDVKDGFAKNFLIPAKKVEVATPEVLARWQNIWAGQAKHQAENLAKLENAKKNLDSTVFEAVLKKTKDGGVAFSVNKQMIKEYLEKQTGLLSGLKIEKDDIQLEHNLKDEGEHLVKISLRHGLEAKLRIKISYS